MGTRASERKIDECTETKTGIYLLQDGSEEPFNIRLHLAKDLLTIQEQDVICVSGEPFYSSERTVTIRRQTIGGFGLSIKGGAEHKIPVVISKISKEQKAELSGLLFIGDGILQVQVLRNAGEEVTLTVSFLKRTPAFLKLPLCEDCSCVPSDQSSGTSSPLCDSGLHLNYHPNNTGGQGLCDGLGSPWSQSNKVPNPTNKPILTKQTQPTAAQPNLTNKPNPLQPTQPKPTQPTKQTQPKPTNHSTEPNPTIGYYSDLCLSVGGKGLCDGSGSLWSQSNKVPKPTQPTKSNPTQPTNTTQPNPLTKSNPTQPNPTNPPTNQIQPNPTQPNPPTKSNLTHQPNPTQPNPTNKPNPTQSNNQIQPTNQTQPNPTQPTNLTNPPTKSNPTQPNQQTQPNPPTKSNPTQPYIT
ncbi:hypothetical protein DNTS_007574 [Danionella cerebrum]|uniref:PDZ domain-containing protein n=1 Tax=Danionella cerebrum TaxID=2873325 RepID=A0A553N5A3_9TELE|nr:hypothetical protein DNTS_007574 [Danionella translucida]